MRVTYKNVTPILGRKFAIVGESSALHAATDGFSFGGRRRRQDRYEGVKRGPSAGT
jgi:hypothetical protein